MNLVVSLLDGPFPSIRLYMVSIQYLAVPPNFMQSPKEKHVCR